MGNSNHDDPFKDLYDDPFDNESERGNGVSDSANSTEKVFSLSSDFFRKVEEQIDKDAQSRISAYENINKIDEINTIQSHEHRELLAITRGLDKNIKGISKSLSNYSDLVAKNDKNIRLRIFDLDSRITDCRKSIQTTDTEFFDQIKKQQKKQRDIIMISIFGFLINLLLITFVFVLWESQKEIISELNTAKEEITSNNSEIEELNKNRLIFEKDISGNVNSLSRRIDEALLPKTLSVLSVDHSSGKEGQYFNFSVESVDHIFGHKNWHGSRVPILQLRTGKISPAVIWRSEAGASKGDGHGRWDDNTSKPGQWQTDDLAVLFVHR